MKRTRNIAEITHPEIAMLMRRAWEDRRRRKEPVSFEHAAREMEVTPSAVHSWYRGRQKPNQTRIEPLARYFYSNDKQAQKRFVDDLNKALNAEAHTIARDPLEDLVRAGRPLKIGFIEYGEFGKFFRALFKWFAAYAGFTQSSQQETVPLNGAIDAVCDEGSLHLVASVLETPDRSKKVKFIAFPIAVPVNAVMLTPGRARGEQEHDYEERRKEIIQNVKQALLGREPGGRLPYELIRPVVNEQEVGGLHVKNLLRLRADQYIATDFDVDEFVSALNENSSSAKTCVVLADEVTCLQVQSRLAPEETELVFPPGGSLMPRYRLGFFVSREHERFIQYLEDAFTSFLDSNFELVAREYAQLYRNLREQSVDDKTILSWLSLTGLTTDTQETGNDDRDAETQIQRGQTERIFELMSLLLKNPWPKILERAANAISNEPPKVSAKKQQSDSAKRSKK